MLPEIAIAGRKIGPAHPPLVVAEIGINHEGSLVVAKEMVDAAARAGVEVVKHQTHIVEDEMSGAARKVVPGNATVSIYEIMQRCALSEADERLLQEYVESKGMIFISTPFSRAAADRLHGMNVPAYKIGSGECNNYPLLKHIAGFGKPIILSTGMNTIESVRKAVEIFDGARVPYALMHTTNLYPTPPHLVRLGAMVELGKAFPDAVIGLSDHTTDNVACLGAVALGASILERHFTDHMLRPGSRHRLFDGRRSLPRTDRGERQAAQRARRHQGSCEGRAGDDGLRVRDRRDDCADQGGRDAQQE